MVAVPNVVPFSAMYRCVGAFALTNVGVCIQCRTSVVCYCATLRLLVHVHYQIGIIVMLPNVGPWLCVLCSALICVKLRADSVVIVVAPNVGPWSYVLCSALVCVYDSTVCVLVFVAMPNVGL